MNIVGIDASLTNTGISTPTTTTTIKTKTTGIQRLDTITTTIRQHTQNADLAAIEGYSYNSRNSHAHSLGELGGLIRWHLWKMNIPIVDIPPTSLKLYACGKGNANKDEVFAAAIRRLGYTGNSNDEADALWLRALASDYYGQPLADMPEAHRKAFDKIEWPDLERRRLA